jgi:hypothetical protein
MCSNQFVIPDSATFTGRFCAGAPRRTQASGDMGFEGESKSPSASF